MGLVTNEGDWTSVSWSTAVYRCRHVDKRVFDPLLKFKFAHRERNYQVSNLYGSFILMQKDNISTENAEKTHIHNT